MEKINTYAEYVSALARFDELFFSTDDNTPKDDPSLAELERLSVLLEQYEKETTQIQDNVYLENSVNLHDMEKSLQIRNSTAEFLTFVLDGKEDGVQVMYTDETIWLTQDAIAVLFDKGRTTIVEHLKNIFNEGELDRDSVCRKFRHTASDGKNYSVNYYNLDAVISVGYRANSVRATEFRRWCSKIFSIMIFLTRSVWRTVLSLARTTLSICLQRFVKFASVKEDSIRSLQTSIQLR